MRYERMLAELAVATSGFKQEQDQSNRLGRTAYALNAVVQFLIEDPDVNATGLAAPLEALLLAANELSHGGRPKLIFGCKVSSAAGNWGLDLLKAVVVVGADILITGNAMPVREACKFVAREMKTLGLTTPDGETVSPKRVQDWRNNLNSKGKASDVFREFYQQLRDAQEPTSDLEEAKRRVKELLRIQRDRGFPVG